MPETHSEYVILNASQRQQSLRERTPKLRLEVNCPSCFNFTQWDRVDLATIQHATVPSRTTHVLLVPSMEEKYNLRENWRKVTVENIQNARGLPYHFPTILHGQTSTAVKFTNQNGWLELCNAQLRADYLYLLQCCQIPGCISTLIRMLGQSPCSYKTLFETVPTSQDPI